MTEAELEADVLARPADDAPRRELARLLTARGDPRGELIDLQLEIANIRRSGDRDVRAWSAQWDRAEALRKQYGDAWLPALPPFARDPIYSRGFVESVKIAARDLDRAPELFRVAPIRQLRFDSVDGDAARVFASPHLSRMIALDLFGQQIGDAGVRALAESPHLGRLVWLDLGANRIGPAGLDALLASKRLPRLRYVGFRSNDVESPVEEYGVENGIVATAPSPATIAAEKRFGYREWLHAPSLHANAYPPDPEDLDRERD